MSDAKSEAAKKARKVAAKKAAKKATAVQAVAKVGAEHREQSDAAGEKRKASGSRNVPRRTKSDEDVASTAGVTSAR